MPFLEKRNFKICFENAMEGNIHYINEELNSEISFHEIENVDSKLKTRKAVGNDRISNEVLKCKAVHLTLYKLFCLSYFFLVKHNKKRLCQKKDLLCAFIDLEKAFDWVNRDLLLYKLIEYDVDGNIYKAIKAIHQILCNAE